MLAVVGLILVAMASGCGTRTHGLATIQCPAEAVSGDLNFPLLTDAQSEAMRRTAAKWHHATRERRGVTAKANRLNYMTLFHVEITFDGASLYTKPTLSWIWGVWAPNSSLVRMGFDGERPFVIEEIDPSNRPSIATDDISFDYQRAIEVAARELGDADITRFRLGWGREGGIRIQEVTYPSTGDCICWEVQTRAGEVLRFDARTFKTVTD
jgi:hypothetical protein